uniref:Hypothetical chloroplast protein 108 n=1 Tax=Pyropia perforata TaxID=182771 RepID=A0A023I7C1_PYRPE|nr:hypothetical chloroplast protein 108 [Neoporphyra perforata]AGV01079.1 hypothetical chloroplast protein 108 [Neoporphyra perforata]AHB34982.1 hypothetical chloroplast protein 108 [Neoporphyra perforata]AHB35191.1 hypothetical chloroplast protein 108 [Neoporphyra perforata]AIA19353.1 hypothetical protein [Neoporphyra perforata]AIA19562.1 hypothetical protein [Neoporphyra perforata]
MIVATKPILLQSIIMTTYYFALASQNFLLVKEPLEEVFRERVSYYQSNNKVIDFWLVPNPSFLDKPDMASFKNLVPNDAVAIVSTNPVFINWLKLRIGYICIGQIEDNLQLSEESLNIIIAQDKI